MPSPRDEPGDDGDDGLRAAFFRLPAPAAILDAGFRFVQVNRAFSIEFEYLPEEVAGRKIEVLYDESLQEVSRNAQQLVGDDADPDFRFERLGGARPGRSPLHRRRRTR
nr:PAS domain-containing protein [Burkholderiaceae bacterium]